MNTLAAIMKSLLTLFLLLSMGKLFAQPNEKMKFELSDSYKKDSIQIENNVEFYKYSDKHTDSIDAVRFKIKITNIGNQPIPNFENVMGRSEFLKLFINGKDSYDMNIQNGIGSNKIQYIGKGESDVFETGFILGKNSGIYTYKNPIKLMWKYLGVNSQIVVVDIVSKKIME